MKSNYCRMKMTCLSTLPIQNLMRPNHKVHRNDKTIDAQPIELCN